jgi:hypothetical protein
MVSQTRVFTPIIGNSAVDRIDMRSERFAKLAAGLGTDLETPGIAAEGERHELVAETLEGYYPESERHHERLGPDRYGLSPGGDA